MGSQVIDVLKREEMYDTSTSIPITWQQICPTATDARSEHLPVSTWELHRFELFGEGVL